jgi:hypothetical protein
LATLPGYAELQQQLSAALARHSPKTLRAHLQRLAINLTLIPYHGQSFRDLDEICRGQAKTGTSHFHADATAYCGGPRAKTAGGTRPPLLIQSSRIGTRTVDR